MANTPNEDGSFEIHLDEDSVNAYKQIHAAAQMQHAGAEIERTRAVSIHDHKDLLDHMQSDNGHMMGKFAQYRNSHDEHIPGVRPIDNNFDHELSHKDLIALHHHDHGKYTDDPHTTLDGEHFHH
jgi:hypothetical protein